MQPGERAGSCRDRRRWSACWWLQQWQKSGVVVFPSWTYEKESFVENGPGGAERGGNLVPSLTHDCFARFVSDPSVSWVWPYSSTTSKMGSEGEVVGSKRVVVSASFFPLW